MSARVSSSIGAVRPAASLLASALVVWVAAGCIEPFETPSEYDTQRFLCSDENQDAWDDAVANCAADDACGGVVSFEGKLEGVPVTVESTQRETIFRRVHIGDTDELLLDRIDSFGASPYFEFSLQMKSVGGSAEEEAPAARELTVDRRANTLADGRTDDLITLDLRLTSGGESVDLFGLTGGTVELTSQSPDELSGTFDSSFGSESDQVSGCFVIFPTTVNTSEE